ncbi:hypothetical protein [Microbacterium sp. W4I20]|uniref:hypothetical protein n=1 Tax=Microbacterium sp. W4I20 TaxID=3042262 RepID=UPI002782AF8F|nr:hypothetical protein [Microbacterium sp. W4I20]MDQ0729150.1 hypothetical protein [Microbacterium sp. W4I20]
MSETRTMARTEVVIDGEPVLLAQDQDVADLNASSASPTPADRSILGGETCKPPGVCELPKTIVSGKTRGHCYLDIDARQVHIVSLTEPMTVAGWGCIRSGTTKVA